MCDSFMAEKEHFRDAVRKERDEEIQDIHKRVQSAIEKKDESLEVIIKENTSLKDRCIKLEAIVRQQRKDYCIKWECAWIAGDTYHWPTHFPWFRYYLLAITFPPR